MNPEILRTSDHRTVPRSGTSCDLAKSLYHRLTCLICFALSMMIRNVHDKLTLRRRNEDSIGQELDRCHRSEGKPDQALLDKRNAIANEIAVLEKT
jgi:hypothetical protein